MVQAAGPASCLKMWWTASGAGPTRRSEGKALVGLGLWLGRFFVVAVFGWSTPELSVFDWLAPLSLSQRVDVLVGLVVLVLLFAGGWVLVHVLRQQGRLLLRIEALEAQLAANGMAPQSIPTGNAASPVI